MKAIEHSLVVHEPILSPDKFSALERLKTAFCGDVYNGPGEVALAGSPSSCLFLCGNISDALNKISGATLASYACVYIIEDLSYDFNAPPGFLIDSGSLPLNVHGLGVYFPRLFPTGPGSTSFFDLLMKSHQFQELTESNKPGSSYRKGIYLTPVQDHGANGLEFHLLRCSTNLRGPTENFRDVDHSIMDRVRGVTGLVYPDASPLLNHVLAQVYVNHPESEKHGSEKKSRIKSHSDKTKDMPPDGIIAFCTFYSPDISSKGRAVPGNVMYKNASVLTRLRFRLKESVAEKDAMGLPKEFYVTLEENSLFVMPLSTNRLYMHETVPPSLPVDKIPTRLSYVVRCSSRLALHRHGQTLVQHEGEWVPLIAPTAKDMDRLKAKYLEENVTAGSVEYEPAFFSLNQGDYLAPVL